MINVYLTLPLLICVGLIQGVLLSRVRVGDAQIDLMLLVVLGWTVARGEGEGLLWGFAGGLMLDLFSGGPFGVMTLALVGAAFVAGQQWAQGLDSRLVRPALTTLAGAATYHLVLLLLLAWTGHVVHWGYSLLRVAAPSALLNGALAPLLHFPLGWVERRIRRERFTL